MEQNQMQQSSNYRWVVLFVSFLAFVAFAFVFQLIPPLLKSISMDFGVSEADSGLLMSMAVVPGIFLALPIGLVINKYGFRSLGFFSILLIAIGSLITALANTFVIALLGRFVLGVGGAFIIVGVPTVISQWFSHRDLGKAMGIYNTNMPVAIITAFPTATILMQNFDWHYPFYIGTAVALVTAILFAIIMKEGPLKGESKQIGAKEIKLAVKNAEVWKAILIWMFFNTAAIAFLSWAPTLFQDFKGLEPFQASLLATAIMYVVVVLGPFFGWFADKSGRRKPFLFAGSILMALALNATAYTFALTLLLSVLLFGIASSMLSPVTMIIPAESLPPNLTGTGFSIMILCQNIGITLSAPLAGYLLQTTQSLSSTLLGISLFAFAGAITALTLKTK